MSARPAVLVWLALLPAAVRAAAPFVPSPRGEVGIHDPSSVVACAGRYYVFGTGRGVISRSSADRDLWVAGPRVFADPPAWTTTAVPGFDGTFWAPDVIAVNGTYYLYYSCSTWGSPVSAIGLATSPTLDPASPAYQWTDQGLVIQSTGAQPYNTIDPSLCLAADGRLWMAFGSYWDGIHIIELDPATGRRLNPRAAPVRVADNNTIEAACLLQREPYYYLFVNWGTCCSGIRSTYHIRVGRSTSPTGPFRDRTGADLRAGGGTLFLEATGKYAGPGHFALHRDGGQEWFGYHYYDTGQYGVYIAEDDIDYGIPMFDFRPLEWTAEGWPGFTNDWTASYRFAGSGRDDGGQFFGLLREGAAIRTDRVRGPVVELDGDGAHVRLPVGVANARTFAAVVQWDGGDAWQRIFDFGRDTGRYGFLTPASHLGRPRFAINNRGGERVLDAPSPIPVGVWTHLAVTLSEGGGVLYVNGAPVAANPEMTIAPHAVMATNNTLGLSQFPVDPPFRGRISSFRAHGRALSAAEITAPQVDILAPADGERYTPGQTVSFHGHAADFADVPLTNTAWWAELIVQSRTNRFFGPVTGRAAGTFTAPASVAGAIRLHFRGTDAQARTSHCAVNLVPDPDGHGSWTSLYPFDHGAADAAGPFPGTLVNGALTRSEPVRGPIVQLDGVNDYIDLPDGLTGLRTFAAWVKLSDHDPWQRVFDFGTGTRQYAFLTASGPSGSPRFGITTTGVGERTVEAPDPLPLNTWVHLAVVLDGPQAVLFVNGEAVAVNYSVHLLPSDLGADQNYLGRSQFPDPYLQGRLDSVLVSSRSLDLASFLPLPLAIAANPDGLTLAWPAGDAARSLHQAARLTPDSVWTPLESTPSIVNGMNVMEVPAGGATGFYRTQWP